MVIILRGIPGVGKSSLVKLLMSNDFKYPGYDADPVITPAVAKLKPLWKRVQEFNGEKHRCSSDDFFMDGDVYKFDVRYLGQAHGQCYRKYVDMLRSTDPRDMIVVDNTNCSLVETAAYAQAAMAYNRSLEIITLIDDPKKCFERNIHGLTFEKVYQMHLTLLKSLQEYPTFWPLSICDQSR